MRKRTPSEIKAYGDGYAEAYKEFCHLLDRHDKDKAIRKMKIFADAVALTVETATDTADTPQTESTGSPIGDYRDGVGAWQTDKLTEEEFDTMIAKGLLGQTDCEDRYAVRTDSGEVVAYACPLGCEHTDCGWK